MIPKHHPFEASTTAHAPFLPLAFRLGATFILMVLRLALPGEAPEGPPGEAFYMICLAVLFLEGIWEAAGSIRRCGTPFATPAPGWIRFNLLLDALLVTLIIAFHGVDQERLATIYIFPVLASAFYLRNYEIVGVGILSSTFHITSALLFTYGVIGSFGGSTEAPGLEPGRLAFILGFATLQIFAATLVVVVIRKNLENLRQDLSKSEAVVDELSTMYRQVFESMLAGLITVDMEGTISSANPAAQKILQRPLLTGAPIESQGLGSLADLSEHPGEQRFERTVSTEDGERRIIGGNLVPLRGQEGATTGHLLVFQDLTDIKHLEERTRLSEKLATVGELSAEMAHELRNPMASILGCVQLLRHGDQSRIMMDRVLTILCRESERVSALVTDFLDFTRPRPVRIQPVALAEIIEQVRASWETDPRSEGLPLATDSVPELSVLGDPVCAHQVFTNLLSNARKALKDTAEPLIRLSFRARPGTILVTVSDNGCGMTEERRKLVFMPFASGFEQGTGLGMSLVFQFVQQMGWSIQIESSLGTGTAISLSIPVAPGNLSPGP